MGFVVDRLPVEGLVRSCTLGAVLGAALIAAGTITFVGGLIADLIAANRVGNGQGFESDDNELLLVWEGGSCWLRKDSKARLAQQLIEKITSLYPRRFNKQISSEHHAKHSA